MSIWLTDSEIKSLPHTGEAWANVLSAAEGEFDAPNLTLRNYHGVECFAAALAWARTRNESFRTKLVVEVNKTLNASIDLDDALDACRSLGIYAIAMSTANLDPKPYRDWFRNELRRVYRGGGGGGSIIQIHERRPNNWGAHAFASRVAVDLYIGDEQDLQRAVQVHQEFLGVAPVVSNFDYGELSWQSDASRPVGINRVGATINGHDVDGVIPDDQRRSGQFAWPPKKENYVYECLQGLITGTVLLCRNGYPDAHRWSDSALKRAYRWLYQVCKFPAEGDDRFQVDLLHYLYGDEVAYAALPASPYQMGKAMGYADWSHRGRRLANVPEPLPPPPIPPSDPCAELRSLNETLNNENNKLATQLKEKSQELVSANRMLQDAADRNMRAELKARELLSIYAETNVRFSSVTTSR